MDTNTNPSNEPYRKITKNRFMSLSPHSSSYFTNMINKTAFGSFNKWGGITYSDILLALLEVGKNSNSYLFAYSSKSKCFWTDILEYTILKKIFSDFKAETLRKYWSELSKYDTEDSTELIKKNKSYLDKLPLKLGTIVSSISKMLSGKIKELKE